MTGHFYNNIYMKIIGYLPNDTCEMRNTKESAEHLIFNCHLSLIVVGLLRSLKYSVTQMILSILSLVILNPKFTAVFTNFLVFFFLMKFFSSFNQFKLATLLIVCLKF